MGLNAAVLWPIFSPPGTWIVATLFMIPFLAGFTRDWLVVSGGVDPTSARYARTLRRTVEATTGWLPLGLRIVVAVVAGWLGIGHLFTALRAEAPWQLGAGAIVFATAVLISLGILGRLASLTMLVTIGLTMTGSRLDVTTIVMMIGASLLLLLGTGRFSIWKPEDDFLSRRYGEKQGKGGDVEHG
jgi:CDP-diacylglycerol--glycerol-3-phosphate 3-phosphatidyltransferase